MTAAAQPSYKVKYEISVFIEHSREIEGAEIIGRGLGTSYELDGAVLAEQQLG